jgi:3-mercaptopyruvate sulfurtransferase SseA
VNAPLQSADESGASRRRRSRRRRFGRGHLADLKVDFVNEEHFEELLSQKGVGNDHTVMLYGGNNWFEAYVYC